MHISLIPPSFRFLRVDENLKLMKMMTATMMLCFSLSCLPRLLLSYLRLSVYGEVAADLVGSVGKNENLNIRGSGH